jgi:hypothetical protein
MGGASKCHFVLKLQVGSPKIPKISPPTTLEAHNFFCKPLIKVTSKPKLYPSSRAFQQYVACHLHPNKLGRFSTFSGEHLNWHFYSRPFFWP